MDFTRRFIYHDKVIVRCASCSKNFQKFGRSERAQIQTVLAQ
jgi:hypothetical protein